MFRGVKWTVGAPTGEGKGDGSRRANYQSPLFLRLFAPPSFPPFIAFLFLWVRLVFSSSSRYSPRATLGFLSGRRLLFAVRRIYAEIVILIPAVLPPILARHAEKVFARARLLYLSKCTLAPRESIALFIAPLTPPSNTAVPFSLLRDRYPCPRAIRSLSPRDAYFPVSVSPAALAILILTNLLLRIALLHGQLSARLRRAIDRRVRFARLPYTPSFVSPRFLNLPLGGSLHFLSVFLTVSTLYLALEAT